MLNMFNSVKVILIHRLCVLMGMEVPVLKAEMTHAGDLLTDDSVFAQLIKQFVWELTLVLTASELQDKHTERLMHPYGAKISVPSSRWDPSRCLAVLLMT